MSYWTQIVGCIAVPAEHAADLFIDLQDSEEACGSEGGLDLRMAYMQARYDQKIVLLCGNLRDFEEAEQNRLIALLDTLSAKYKINTEFSVVKMVWPLRIWPIMERGEECQE